MPTTSPREKRPTTTKQAIESPEQRAIRLSHEAALIAQAEADIEAGLGIDGDDLEAWLDQLDIDPNTPLTKPRQKKP